MKFDAIYGVAGVITGFWLVVLPSLLVLAGYADVAAAIWAVAMAASGIWLSAKGMALLNDRTIFQMPRWNLLTAAATPASLWV